MSKKITRRAFIKQGTVLAGGVLGGMALGQPMPAGAATPDIFVVRGTNYFENTIKAIEGLGGMDSIVSRGSRVGLLVNHAFLNIGAHVHPDMTIAIARMCYDAGARSVILIKSPPWRYYRRGRSDSMAKEVIRKLKSPSDVYKKVPVKGGVALKQADIMQDLLECDVFINTAIVKSHSATFITAALKNMMGSAPFSTCLNFHKGGLFNDDPAYLAQCIADINLIRKPDLCVMDATEVLATGGPHGPGLLKRPHKVFAGRDPVAVDTYATRLLNIDPNKILMLDYASRHGLGQKDLSKVFIKEIE
ncbi:MAG: DUF362 domain-containing protein [Deltaproteobacteria bacterium]|nr:DUF362 domain-containing protein [Deltaproteobacteria bacterium]